MSSCELILYAVPTGALAAACDAYFAEASAIGGTVAQTYPPHCTLTGFFRRSEARRDEMAADIAARIRSIGHPPPDAVEIVGLQQTSDWIGLELRSPWLEAWTAARADEMPALDGEDPLRCKHWLHLSLAYGVDDLGPYASTAADFVLPSEPGPWRLAFYERSGTDWRLLAGG